MISDREKLIIAGNIKSQVERQLYEAQVWESIKGKTPEEIGAILDIEIDKVATPEEKARFLENKGKGL